MSLLSDYMRMTGSTCAVEIVASSSAPIVRAVDAQPQRPDIRYDPVGRIRRRWGLAHRCARWTATPQADEIGTGSGRGHGMSFRLAAYAVRVRWDREQLIGGKPIEARSASGPRAQNCCSTVVFGRGPRLGAGRGPS
jgi:hypothetical protein